MLGGVLYLFLLTLVSTVSTDHATDCPDGWTTSTNTALGCLLFTEEKPATACEAKHMCDLRGTKTDTALRGQRDAVVQMVEVTDVAAAEKLAEYADFIEKDATWWLGMSYDVTGSTPGFSWNSDPTSVVTADFSDIFTPDETPPIINNDLCVVMNVENNKPVWDDVKCFDSSPAKLICQCIDKCPAAAVTASPTDPQPTDPPLVCVGEWILVEELGCVQLLPDASGQTYEEASSTCSGLGGYLVELETEAQIQNLASKEELFASIYPECETFWLGMSDEEYEGFWLLPVAHTMMDNGLIPWATSPAQPDGDKAENCAVATLNADNAGWHDVACDSTEFLGKKIVPICLEDKSTPASTDPAQSSASPASTDPAQSTPVVFPPNCQFMDAQQDTCYLYIRTEAEWKDAEAYCVSLGGHLVSSLSEAENNFIGSSVIELYPIWLGASGSGSAGFTWADGSAWDFEFWRDGEPGSASDEECVYLSPTTRLWNAYKCDYPLRSVCKLA